jgi:hypothetical protein
MRLAGVLALLALAAAAAAREKPVRVRDALCVSQSDAPFLALDAAARDVYLAALADTGWTLVRIDFTWSRIQPSPPPAPLDFSRYDEIVRQASAHGIRVVGILDYGVDWAAASAPTGDDRYPPDDPATFAAFAAATARHYRKRVRTWEVWNEPNNGLSGFWKPEPDPAGYARLAAAAARALRRAAPRATLVTGGLAPTLDILIYGTDWAFFTAATAAVPDWHRGFDAAALHPYTLLQAPPPEDESLPLGPSVVHQMANFRDRLAESGADRLPLWVTELGWHTALESGFPLFPPGVSELDQARFLVRGTVLTLAAGAQRMCWYTLLDYPNFLHDKEAAFGLFHYQPTPIAGALDPKPAYGAARTLATVLGPTRFERDLRADLGLPSTAYAYAFRHGPRSRVLVLWATADADATQVPIARGVRRVRRVEMDGASADLGRPASVDVTLTPTPVYLLLE